MRTPDAVPANAAAACVAVTRGAGTVREVAKACGWASLSTAQSALDQALLLGLVEWDWGGSRRVPGSLRPALRVVT